MTTKNYDAKVATDAKLDDLYRIAEAIEEKVENILEELKDMAESQIERACRRMEPEYGEDLNGF